MLTASDAYMSTRVRSGAAAAQAQAREAYAAWEHKAAPPRAAASGSGEPSHYDELGVARNASAEHIKRRHRALMLKFHPDKHRGDDAAAAAARTARISAAYEVLRDPALRELYDLELR